MPKIILFGKLFPKKIHMILWTLYSVTFDIRISIYESKLLPECDTSLACTGQMRHFRE